MAKESAAERSRVSSTSNPRWRGSGLTLAQAARRVAEELRGQGDEETAKVTEAAADRAERLAGYLRDSSGDAFLRDVESLRAGGRGSQRRAGS